MQIERIKMFVNTSRGRLELMVYDQLIKNTSRCRYNREAASPSTLYGTMNVTDAVVSS